jgi:uncharacterized protein YqhQ
MSEMKVPANEMKFSYGGQAVIEGVLMRGANTAAIAVRDPKGQIVVHEQPLNKTLYRGRIARTPFLRGLVGLWDALGLGTRALMWSADVAVGEEETISFNGPIGFATIAVSLLLGVGLFFILPTVAATGIGNVLGIHSTETTTQVTTDGTSETPAVVESAPVLYQPLPIGLQATIINFIEAVVQLGILVVYISVIGQMNDVKRLFGYHGAEHKTINAYEAGDDLTPEIVIKYPIEHPRCGTAFLLTVVFVSVFVFSLLGRPPLPLLILSRVIFIPVIAGISYELLKWTAANVHRPWVRLMIKPNLALQHLTTRQPDLAMCEVAIVAFKRVLLSEGLISAEEAAIPAPQPQATAQAAGVAVGD